MRLASAYHRNLSMLVSIVELPIAVTRTVTCNLYSFLFLLCVAPPCSLHCHFCIWGGLPAHVLQRVSTCPPLVDVVAKVLESMFTAELPPAVHIEGLLRRRAGQQAPHDATSMAPVFRPLTMEAIHALLASQPGADREQVVQAHRDEHDRCFKCRALLVAETTNIHAHNDIACRRETTAYCRLCKPTADTDRTGVVELECVPDPTTKKWDGSEGERVQAKPGGVTAAPDNVGLGRDKVAYPLDLQDTRLQVWELLRTRLVYDHAMDVGLPEHLRVQLAKLSAAELDEVTNALAKRNGLLVEFNPTLTAVLGCNTAAYILGGVQQARGALW